MAGDDFPPLASPHAYTKRTTSSTSLGGPNTMRRRKSSTLGEMRGDTGAGSLATLNSSDVSPPVSRTPTPGNSKERRSKRRRAKNLFNRWKRYSLKHTWVTPLVLVLLILAAYYISPGEHNPLHSAIFLSYANPSLAEQTSTLPASLGPVTQYGKGGRDFAFIAFYTIVLSFTREFAMQRLIRPLALRWRIRNRTKQARFMEQFYTALYFVIFGPFGLYVMSRTPVWYFNTAGMYAGFPHRAHEGLFKAYYLLQASYWAQQGLVLLLQLEKPRKDHKELMLHHVVTLALIWCSYRFHFTYMGIPVFVAHDISDFFLATSKVLNYIDHPLVAPYFASFALVWAYLRHYQCLRILLSITNEFATVGSFTLNWETQQYKCWISQYITFALLAVLQLVNLFWFFLILRIGWRFLRASELADERSEYEEDTAEETGGVGVEAKEGLEKVDGGVVPGGKEVEGGMPSLRVNGVVVTEGEGGEVDEQGQGVRKR
ncbi:hypothetical protein MBLNU230_g4559t1 [Neophaeotheca triangularis]